MILSIESSCDDSSIALTSIADKKLIFHKKISQELEHSAYGGVVPELAARLHATALPKILEEIKEYLQDVKAVAVTNEPGLSVTLIEGVMMAKALCLSLNIPLIPINHLKGHIYSLFIEKDEEFPLSVLLVSGGHTQILYVKNYETINLLGNTKDDSFGESFDKLAKMLNLGYPGGPIVEKYAKNGNENRFNFTTPLQGSNEIAFSYSGLKNQVRLCIESFKNITEQDKCDICASFQKTASMHIISKLKKVFEKHHFENFAVVGGASANLYLRNKLNTLCKKFNINLLFAPLEFCSDNAAMIGRAGIKAYELNRFVDIDKIVINPKISKVRVF
ncbi:MAG: tRNA (adenosine(37)-N6)-threonylcarbamoyltransferase complex transferase subunit TsaD [Campylobacteraceae bacterium]|jgi:N6-L-threonylcarbamoyladenine synthase|nr:tRNA (adenosine(37)-N6)-threonylcarbamoyltransferase complex transferase subunit TsaD [Campylobacteraceae bacterium]